jgi:predicted transcriptional regulator
MNGQKKTEGEQEMFTTTISISQEIHRKLKHLAVDEGVAVRDLIRQAIDQLLVRREKGNADSDISDSHQ